MPSLKGFKCLREEFTFCPKDKRETGACRQGTVTKNHQTVHSLPPFDITNDSTASHLLKFLYGFNEILSPIRNYQCEDFRETWGDLNELNQNKMSRSRRVGITVAPTTPRRAAWSA